MLTVGIHGVPDPAGLGRSHDHGVAVLRDGKVVFLRELERATGRKHDCELDLHLDSVLAQVLRGNEEMVFVLANSFLGASFESRSRSLRVSGPANLDVRQVLAECPGSAASHLARSARFFSICHEAAHLGTCLPFFGDFLPNSLLVHIDGGASQSCASAWIPLGRRLECLDYGWHATLKGAVNNFNASVLAQRILGLDPTAHLSMPGKLMGLAGLAAPSSEATGWLADRDWLREPRADLDLVKALREGLTKLDIRQLSPADRGCQVLASCMQTHLEEEVLRYLGRLKELTGTANLYYSGGAALNVHANARIESELGFDNVFIPPAPSDTGLALGAAAVFAWASGGAVERHSPFLNSVDVVPRLPDSRQRRSPLRVTDSLREVADTIADGKVVAVWTGAAEVGPRALGHRSLLLRPDSVDLRRKVSEGMKQREWYRPVAPMMLPEVAVASLEGYRPGSNLAAFMLGAWKVKPEWRQAFSGCVHADGSVRAQVVEETTPGLEHVHQLLALLRTKHGVQGVINTSFNRRGQPIVLTWDEAVSCAEAMRVDVLWRP